MARRPRNWQLVGVVDRTLTDIISLSVEADTQQEAFDKARKVLAVYPEGHDIPGVDFVYIDERKYHVNDLQDIREIEREDRGVA